MGSGQPPPGRESQRRQRGDDARPEQPEPGNGTPEPDAGTHRQEQIRATSPSPKPGATSSRPEAGTTSLSPEPGVSSRVLVTTPQQVETPTVIGDSVGQATRVLETDGFQVKVANFGPIDSMFDYSPVGSAPPGSTVTIDVGY